MALEFIGHLLLNRRADQSLSVWEKLVSDEGITVTSPSFDEGGSIPKEHAGRGVGDNVSPALAWSGVPVTASHLVFVLEDVDVPFARPLIHTIAIVPPDATALAEGELARGATSVHLLRGLMGEGYRGPRPIPGHGAHHYRFMLFAVDADVDTSSQKAAIESMAGHVVARGRLVGTYEQP